MLKKKMIRDVLQNKSQFITIFLMVLIGVMVYVGIESYMDGMINAADKFYSENNLQDLNVMGNNLTKEDLELLEKTKNKNTKRDFTQHRLLSPTLTQLCFQFVSGKNKAQGKMPHAGWVCVKISCRHRTWPWVRWRTRRAARAAGSACTRAWPRPPFCCRPRPRLRCARP